MDTIIYGQVFDQAIWKDTQFDDIQYGGPYGGTCKEAGQRWQGCTRVLSNECRTSCAASDYCSTTCGNVTSGRCVDTCRNGCSNLPTLCGQYDSPARCAELAAQCPRECKQACIAQQRSITGTPRWGKPRDLSHNLTEVFRGDHRTSDAHRFLVNTYGTDIERATFDAVVTQLNEQVPSSSPAAHELNLTASLYLQSFEGAFVSVNICPMRTCSGTGYCPPSGRVPGVEFEGLQGPDGLPAPQQDPVTQSTLTDPYGFTWVFFADRRGRIIRSENKSTGSVWRYNYDGDGRLIGSLNPEGERQCLVYDDLGNVIEHYTLPARSRVTETGSASTPDFLLRRFAYRRFQERSPFELQKVIVRPEVIYDPRNPSLELLRFTWDDFGYLVSVRNGAGETTTYETDDAGRPVTEHAPGGVVTSYEYQFGALSKVTRNPSGDANARVVSELQPDEAGRPRRAVGELGEVIDWVWRSGRLERIGSTNDGRFSEERLEYDPTGTLKNRKVLVGGATIREMTVHADAFGRASMVEDTSFAPAQAPQRRRTCQRRGPDGRLLESIDAEGIHFLPHHNGEGNMTGVAAGSPTKNGLWSAECPKNSGTERAYGLLADFFLDRLGRPVNITDARGKITTVERDGFGREIRTVDPTGAVRMTGYDALSNPIWHATYAGDLAPEKYRKPDRGDAGLLAMVELSYDPAGRLVTRNAWHFDKDGAVGDGDATSTYRYDFVNRRVSLTDDSGGVTTLESDRAGRPLALTAPTGDKVTWDYAERGRLIRKTVTAPTTSGVVSEIVRLTSWGAPSIRFKTQPQALPRLPDVVTTGTVGSLLEGFLRSTPSGRKELLIPVVDHVWGYDALKRLVGTQGAGGLLQSFTYDGWNRVVNETTTYDSASNAEVVSFAWDRADKLTSRTSVAGEARRATTTYRYDALDRLRRIDRPEGVFEELSYLDNSNLVDQRKDSRKVTMTMTYDDLGRITEVLATQRASTRPGGTAGDDDLNPGPRPELITNRRNYEYDALGRITSGRARYENVGDPIVASMEWDSLGNLTRTWNSEAGESNAITHGYDGRAELGPSQYGDVVGSFRERDANGRLTALYVAGSKLVDFTYRGMGGPSSRRAGSVNTSYGYNSYGVLTSLSDAGPGGRWLSRWRWESPADDIPRIAGERLGEAAEVASTFTVDRGGRLTGEGQGVTGLEDVRLSSLAGRQPANSTVASALQSSPSRRTYTLDARANWTRRSSNDETLETSPTINLLDSYTQFAGEACEFDAGGLQTTFGDDERYSYDLFGNLTRVESALGTRLYRYDAFNRLTIENPPFEQTTTYVWDGARRSIRKTGEHSDVTLDGDALDEHLALVGREGSSARQLQFVHQDRAGSVYMLTSLDGRMAEHYRYTAYGEMTVQRPDGGAKSLRDSAAQWGFQGQAFDRVTGFVHMRSRWMDPRVGRFLQTDPIGLAGGPNLYSFVGSAPLKFTDPFGLAPLPLTITAVGEQWWDQQPQISRLPWRPGDLQRNLYSNTPHTVGSLIPLGNGTYQLVQSPIPDADKWIANLGPALAADVLALPFDLIVLIDALHRWNRPWEIDRAQPARQVAREIRVSMRPFEYDTPRQAETAEVFNFGAGILIGRLRVPRAFTFHKHHTVPREILKALPNDVANNPLVRGRAGFPNRWSIPEHLHKLIHRGAGGGAYNEAFKARLRDLGREPTVEDVLKVRDDLVEQFGLERYRP